MNYIKMFLLLSLTCHLSDVPQLLCPVSNWVSGTKMWLSDFCFAFAALLHWYIVHRAGGEWSCSDFIQLSHALLTVIVGSFLVHFNAFLCFPHFGYFLYQEKNLLLLFASGRFLIQLPFLISMYDFIICVMLNLQQSHPSQGLILTFFKRKRRKGFAAVVDEEKKFFKINTFLLLWLHVLGHEWECYFVPWPEQSFEAFFSPPLNVYTLYSVWSNLVLWGITWWQQRVKAQTNTHILPQVLPGVPQLKSAVEGAVVLTSLTSTDGRAGLADLRLLLSSRMNVYFFPSFWFFLHLLLDGDPCVSVQGDPFVYLF